MVTDNTQNTTYYISKAVIGIYRTNISLCTFVVYIENFEI